MPLFKRCAIVVPSTNVRTFCSLREQGLAVVEIDDSRTRAERVSATLDAMRSGADVVAQAALTDETWNGYADVLRRLERPSALGEWSYEPYDTKLARETRGGTILQLAVYVDLLTPIQGVAPQCFHVVTPAAANGGPFTTHSYRYAEFEAYVRLGTPSARRDCRAWTQHNLRNALSRADRALRRLPMVGALQRSTPQGRSNLSFIAGLSRLHREELTARGYPTLATAAAMPLPIPFKPSRGVGGYVRPRSRAGPCAAPAANGGASSLRTLAACRDGQGLCASA